MITDSTCHRRGVLLIAVAMMLSPASAQEGPATRPASGAMESIEAGKVEVSVTPPAVRARLERAIEAWRARPQGSADDLAQRLAACGSQGVPALTSALGREDAPELTEARARALGRIGGNAAFEALVSLLASEDPAARSAAVGGLALLDGGEAGRHLLVAVADPSAVVSGAAITATAEKHARSPTPTFVWKAADHLSRSKRKLPYARLLARMGTPEAKRSLRAILDQSGDPRTRLAALQGLACLQDPEDGDLVLGVLSSADPVLRRQACTVLGRLGHEPATRSLIDLLHSEDRGLAANAHWALQRITGERLKLDAQLWEEWWEAHYGSEG